METMKSLIERLEKMPEEVSVDAAFGQPTTAEGYTVIPVAEINYGFGLGAGSAPSGEGTEGPEGAAGLQEVPFGGGGGAGARTRPIAYIEIGPEGTRVKSVTDEKKIALAGILLSAWTVGWLAVVLKSIFGRRG